MSSYAENEVTLIRLPLHDNNRHCHAVAAGNRMLDLAEPELFVKTDGVECRFQPYDSPIRLGKLKSTFKQP